MYRYYNINHIVVKAFHSMGFFFVLLVLMSTIALDIVAIRAHIVVVAADCCQLFFSISLISFFVAFFLLDVRPNVSYATACHAARLSVDNFFPFCGHTRTQLQTQYGDYCPLFAQVSFISIGN